MAQAMSNLPLSLQFEVLGPPVGKQRARVFQRGGKTRAVTPLRTRQYEAAVRGRAFFAVCKSWPLDRRYKLHVAFTGRCDVDNVFKSVADALEGVLYANDRQIDKGSHERLRGGAPRTVITCEVLP